MITVEHLTKYYGDHLAVRDLSFEIPGGHVYGFLGPNGAGKSTTMNIMTGCLSATEGKVLIDGHDIFEEPREAKRLIGYLPEQPPLYLNESPVDYLRFVGSAKGLRGEELNNEVAKAIEQTGIEQVKNRRIGTLSKGYKQRVGIAQALLGNPSVIILDEPTVGLDPIQILEIRDLIKALGEQHTVIFSSHILSEVQAICDEILMIAHGRLVAFDTAENLERRLLSPNELTLTTDAPEEAVREALSGVDGVTDISVEKKGRKYLCVHVKTSMDAIYDFSRAVFEAFVAHGLTLVELSLRKANLEDIFMELAEAATAEEDEKPASDEPRMHEAALPAEENEPETSEAVGIIEEKEGIKQ